MGTRERPEGAADASGSTASQPASYTLRSRPLHAGKLLRRPKSRAACGGSLGAGGASYHRGRRHPGWRALAVAAGVRRAHERSRTKPLPKQLVPRDQRAHSDRCTGQNQRLLAARGAIVTSWPEIRRVAASRQECVALSTGRRARRAPRTRSSLPGVGASLARRHGNGDQSARTHCRAGRATPRRSRSHPEGDPRARVRQLLARRSDAEGTALDSQEPLLDR